MPTDPEIREMERDCQKQRLDLARRFLRIDETKKSDEGDITLANRVLAAAKGDGAAFDRALADRHVRGIFQRGVLFLANGTVRT